jgi:hypothetical protein
MINLLRVSGKSERGYAMKTKRKKDRKEERNQGGDSRILVSIEHGCHTGMAPRSTGPLEFEIHRTRVCILTKAKSILEEEEESM